MEQTILGIMKKIIGSIIRKFKFIFEYIIRKKYKRPSYYPEKERKSSLRIILENIRYILKYENQYFYLTNGFDCKDVDQKEYCVLHDFASTVKRLNHHGVNGDHTILLKDKSLFEIMCNHYEIPSVTTIGKYQKGVVEKLDGNRMSLIELLEERPHLFFKLASSEKGKGVCSVDYNEGKYYLNDVESSYSTIEKTLDSSKTEYMVQIRLMQHQDINRLYGHSINTLRIATVLHKEECVVLGTFLRCGTNGMVCDNGSQGGALIGVEESGRLYKYGFFLRGGTKSDRHPNTGVVFSEFQVPYYEEALELVKRAHTKAFHDIKTVGWDVAITPDGPVLIEGNTNYSGPAFEMCMGGMKQKFQRYLK